MKQLQQELRDEHGVVFPDAGLGAGHDQDLAALEDRVEVEAERMAKNGVDLARGDQALDLVPRWVERLRRVAAIRDQVRELHVPIGTREVSVVAALQTAQNDVAVPALADVEHAVDVPESRLRLDEADGVNRLTKERIRRGLDRAWRIGLDESLKEHCRARSCASLDGQRVDADLGSSKVEV